MALVIEAAAGHYETRDVEFGKVYAWRPGHVVIECGCGKMESLSDSAPVCRGCGTDHAGTVGEGLAVERSGDESLHTWRYAGDREDAGLPY